MARWDRHKYWYREKCKNRWLHPLSMVTPNCTLRPSQLLNLVPGYLWAGKTLLEPLSNGDRQCLDNQYREWKFGAELPAATWNTHLKIHGRQIAIHPTSHSLSLKDDCLFSVVKWRARKQEKGLHILLPNQCFLPQSPCLRMLLELLQEPKKEILSCARFAPLTSTAIKPMNNSEKHLSSAEAKKVFFKRRNTQSILSNLSCIRKQHVSLTESSFLAKASRITFLQQHFYF